MKLESNDIAPNDLEASGERLEKRVERILDSPDMHWVGDGFPVRSIFNYDDHGALLSPFLLLDHTAPMHFEPAAAPRGVGQHPHRGFETVSIVYDGELAHRDSGGGSGTIGAGDVQWMTAGAGVLHDEFHSLAFTRDGGVLEGIQLWVNLPAARKTTPSRYQTLRAAQIPSVRLPDDAGHVRVIAGTYEGVSGPALTFTPIDVRDVRLRGGRSVGFRFVDGHTLVLVVVRGAIAVRDTEARVGQAIVMERGGRDIAIDARLDAAILILSGEPIDETIVGYGPFVMNTPSEIQQAVDDFNAGRFGRIPA